ncbi:Signal recognition particle subunit SRP68 [Porphyridium purpureum]|uniref:Signal recognition particle subunit SRP68 n=1 Tax=Porphyridium purpureum TaxID=35688 RepID=A0A5J4Z9R2_PORPP|nr:Signal recognition particle subunit SRP68 [Porphyridium purpureum]|eukprot:POR9349..scf295_1
MGQIKRENEAMEVDAGSAVEAQKVALHILGVSKAAQQTHGLKHGDYRRYRRFCSGKIHHLRRILKLTNGRGQKFVKREVTTDVITVHGQVRALDLILWQAERSWSYSMEMKDLESNKPEQPQKMRRLAIRKLKRAVLYAQQLHDFCVETAEDRTRLEADAYVAWMKGNLYLEREMWAEALEHFVNASGLYEGMANVLESDPDSVYRSRVEEISPSIRFCKYHLGLRSDGARKDDLVKLMNESGLANDLLKAKIDVALAEERKRLAQSFGTIDWLGKQVAMRSERTREAVLAAREAEASLRDEMGKSSASLSLEEKAALYDGVFSILNESIQGVQRVVRELKNDEKESADRVQEVVDVASFLSFSKNLLLIERNQLLIEILRTPSSKTKSSTTRPEDFVRLYETLVQVTRDMLELPGVSEFTPISDRLNSNLTAFRALRCHYLALCYADLKSYKEAVGLLDRAIGLSEEAIRCVQDEEVLAQLHANVDSCVRDKMRVLAENYRDQVALSNGVDRSMSISKTSGRGSGAAKSLYADLDQPRGAQDVIPVPPEIQPVMCKPLVFDLALDGVQFPPLDAVRSFYEAEKQERASVARKASPTSAKPEEETPKPTAKKGFFSRLLGSS